MKIAFFDTKEYDIESFDPLVKTRGIEVKYFESKLSIDTVSLTKGFDGVCVFVNDSVTKEVIDELYSHGVKAIFLRCAGFNNVDLKRLSPRFMSIVFQPIPHMPLQSTQWPYI